MWWPAARVERDVLGCGPSTRIRLSADVLAAAEAVVAAQRRAARTAEAPVPIGMVQLPKSEEDDAIGRLMPMVAAASAAAAAAAAAPLWRIGTVGTVRPRGISSHGSESDDGGPDSGARRFLPGPFTPPPASAAALSPGDSPWSGSNGDGSDRSAAASVPGAAPPPRNHAPGHGGGPASPRGASESLAARTHSPDGGSGAAADEDALLAMALQAAEEGEEGVAGLDDMLLEEGGGEEEEEEAWLRATIAASLAATAAPGSGNGGEGGDATAAMDVDASGDGSS
jgi:hypothetical protein